MIRILTYHRTPNESGSADEYSTVSLPTLARHLDMLREAGLLPLPPEILKLPLAEREPGFFLTFDDATAGHLEIGSMLTEKFNCRAIFFVPTARVNRAGSLSSAQLKDLHKQGHLIASHSHDHIRLHHLGDEDVRVQVERSRLELEQLLGKPPEFFAPPGGFCNKMVRRVAAEEGIRVLRTMRWGFNRKPDLMSLECVPVNKYFGARHWERFVQGRGRPYVYALKELLKKYGSMVVYEHLRSGFFWVKKAKRRL